MKLSKVRRIKREGDLRIKRSFAIVPVRLNTDLDLQAEQVVFLESYYSAQRLYSFAYSGVQWITVRRFPTRELAEQFVSGRQK